MTRPIVYPDNVSLIQDILDLSSSPGCDLGLLSIAQEKAFVQVEHQYLLQMLNAFGFNSGLIAKIQVLYSDIESVLKINGGLSAPFKIRRGVRQGCFLSGMLYSMAIEPLLHKLRQHLSGINLPGCQQVLNCLLMLMKKQHDIDVLVVVHYPLLKLTGEKVKL